MPKKRYRTLDKIKIVIDPNVKGGARVYSKKELKRRSKRAEEQRKDPLHPFGKGPIPTACYSDPPCQKKHTSKEEATFCYQLSKIIENQPDNWFYKVKTKSRPIDYFLYQIVFIEYHNWYPVSKAPKESQILKRSKLIKEEWKKEKIVEYTTKRRDLLDTSGYQEYPLIVVTLKGGVVPEELPDNSFVATSMDELEEILVKLEIIE